MAKFLNENIAGVKALTQLITLMRTEVSKTIGAQKKLAEGFNLKTVKGIKDLEKAILAINKAEKDKIKLDKQQVTQTEKLRSLRAGELNETLRLRAAINSETKAIRDNIKAESSLTPVLDRKRKQLLEVKQRLQELTITEGKNSRATRAAAKEFNRLNKAVRGAEKAGGDLQRNVGNYPKIFSVATAAVGAAFLAFRQFARVLGNTIQIAIDFEQSNANLAAVLGKSRSEIRGLTLDAQRLGAVTAFTASEVSELQTEFAKLGFDESQILNATEATLSLAAATGTELAEAAAVAGATLGGFGLAADQTQRLVDVMAKSFSLSALDMEKFKESMKTAAPAAKAVGLDVETTTALLGTLSKAGISGSKAGNSLKNTFIELNKKNISLNEGFKEVANSSNKLKTAVGLVGKIAAPAFLVLSEGTEITKGLEEGLRNAGGAAEKMAKEQLNTLGGDLTILNSAWEGFILSLLAGDSAFSGISRSIVSATTALLSMFTATEDASEASFQNALANQASADSTQELLDRYEKLIADGLTPATDETGELALITVQLKNDLGDEVVALNEATGAYELLTDAVRAQITMKRLAASEEASDIVQGIVGIDQQLKKRRDAIAAEEGAISGLAKIETESVESINALLKTRQELEDGGVDAIDRRIAALKDEAEQFDPIDGRSEQLKEQIKFLNDNVAVSEKLAGIKTELTKADPDGSEAKQLKEQFDLLSSNLNRRQEIVNINKELTQIGVETNIAKSLREQVQLLEESTTVSQKLATVEKQLTEASDARNRSLSVSRPTLSKIVELRREVSLLETERAIEVKKLIPLHFEESAVADFLGKAKKNLNDITEAGTAADEGAAKAITGLTKAQKAHNQAIKDSISLLKLQEEAELLEAKTIEERFDIRKDFLEKINVEEVKIIGLTAKEIEIINKELKNDLRRIELEYAAFRVKTEQELLEAIRALNDFEEQVALTKLNERVQAEKDALRDILKDKELTGEARSQQIKEQNDKLAEAIRARHAKELALEQVQRDRIKQDTELSDKERELKIAESNERIRQLGIQLNDDIADLRDKELIDLQATLDAQLSLRKEHAKEVRKVISSMFKQISKTAQDRVKEARKERDQADKDIDNQRDRAQNGLANTLAFEQRQRAEKEKQLIAEEKRLQRVRKIEAFFNSFNANTAALKAGEDSSKALLKTLRDMGLIEAITATFETGGVVGVDNLPSNGVIAGKRHKQGGVQIEAEGGEGIFSRKEMANMGVENFYRLKEMAGKGGIRETEMMQRTSQIITNDDSRVLVALESLENTVKGMPSQQIDIQGVFGKMLRVTEEIKQGKSTTRNHHRIPINGNR